MELRQGFSISLYLINAPFPSCLQHCVLFGAASNVEGRDRSVDYSIIRRDPGRRSSH